jgi:hypothetical protein
MMHLKRAISAIIINAKKNAAIPMKTVIKIEDVTRVLDKAMMADISVPIIPASRQTPFLLIQISEYRKDTEKDNLPDREKRTQTDRNNPYKRG